MPAWLPALLTPHLPRPPCAVEDESFWEGITPLELGQLPALQENVAVLGYPVGGGWAGWERAALHAAPAWRKEWHQPRHASCLWPTSVVPPTCLPARLPPRPQATAWPSARAW